MSLNVLDEIWVINFASFNTFSQSDLLYALLLRFNTLEENLTERELMLFLVSTDSSVCSDTTHNHWSRVPLKKFKRITKAPACNF